MRIGRGILSGATVSRRARPLGPTAAIPPAPCVQQKAASNPAAGGASARGGEVNGFTLRVWMPHDDTADSRRGVCPARVPAPRAAPCDRGEEVSAVPQLACWPLSGRTDRSRADRDRVGRADGCLYRRLDNITPAEFLTAVGGSGTMGVNLLSAAGATLLLVPPAAPPPCRTGRVPTDYGGQQKQNCITTGGRHSEWRGGGEPGIPTGAYGRPRRRKATGCRFVAAGPATLPIPLARAVGCSDTWAAAHGACGRAGENLLGGAYAGV